MGDGGGYLLIGGGEASEGRKVKFMACFVELRDWRGQGTPSRAVMSGADYIIVRFPALSAHVMDRM